MARIVLVPGFLDEMVRVDSNIQLKILIILDHISSTTFCCLSRIVQTLLHSFSESSIRIGPTCYSWLSLNDLDNESIVLMRCLIFSEDFPNESMDLSKAAPSET